MKGGGSTGGGKNMISSSPGRNKNASSAFVRTGDQERIQENGEITLLSRTEEDLEYAIKKEDHFWSTAE